MNWPELDTFTNLQGSQTTIRLTSYGYCLTPLRIYKVLKQKKWNAKRNQCLTPLRIYKVLKLGVTCNGLRRAWHLYEFTRFSNTQSLSGTLNSLLDTFTNLQGSQTCFQIVTIDALLDTFTNLQGSQTQMSHSLPRICLTPLRIYKVLKQHQSWKDWIQGLTPLRIYKVLKHWSGLPGSVQAWHLYEFTRFSNAR